MLNKALGIGLVVLLVGALIVGGAYLLLRDDGAAGSVGSVGSRWEVEHAGEACADGANGSGCDQGMYVDGVGQRGDQGPHGGSYWKGTEADRGGGNRTLVRPEADGVPIAWQTIVGTVVDLEEDLVLQAADGELFVLGLGPSWYRNTQAVKLAVGDEVRATGLYEGGELKAGQVEKLATGQVLVLRDPNGRPGWSGQGWRAQ